MFEACATYEIVGGTRGLIEAIAADAGVEIRTNTRVTAVAQEDSGATVTVADGATLTAAAVVVTLPLCEDGLWTDVWIYDSAEQAEAADAKAADLPEFLRMAAVSEVVSIDMAWMPVG